MQKHLLLLLSLLMLLSTLSYADELDVVRGKYIETQKLVADINQQINAKSPYERPKSCPLKAVRFQNLLDKIITVKNSFQAECKSKNQAVIDKVNSSTDQLNTLISSTNGNENTVYNNQNLSTAISGISTLASKEECFYNIKENGALPILSDIILSVSQLGMLVPSANGLVLAAGGALFSSVLTVINQVLKNRLNWEEEEERQVFTKFNCSFYEVRKDLSDSGLLSIPTEKLKERLSLNVNQLENISHQLDTLKSEKEDLESLLESSLKEHLFADFGHSNQSTLEIAMKWIELLNSEDGLTELSKRRILGDMVLSSEDFLASLAQTTLSDRNELFKNDMLNIFEVLIRTPQNINQLMSMKLSDFSILQQEFQYYIEILIKDLINNKEEVITNWTELDSQFGDLTNGEAQYQLDDLYSELEAKVVNLKNYFENLVKVSKNLLGIKDFSDEDEGSGIKLDILLNYQSVKELIYGKVGHSFFKYLLNEGQVSRRYFYKSVQKFSVNDPDRVQTCRNALKLSEEWIKTKTYAEEANDFLNTNYGLFHDYVKKYKYFMFIPTGKSFERKIKTQVSSLNALKNFNLNKNISKKERKLLKRKTIGRLILNLSSDKAQSEMIQDYVKENRCENMI
jgi:hypothetical protein